jgi:hypothetical protein
MKKLSVLTLLLVMSLGMIGCESKESLVPAITATTTSTIIPPTATSTVETLISKLGFKLPSEISAVPTTGGSTTVAKPGLLSKLLAMQAPTDEGTDYSKATIIRRVAEHELERLEIIQQILSALGQTHYADLENINKGPYKALVSWPDEEQGRATKIIQPWVVDSKMILLGDKEINRVQAWVTENSNGHLFVIKAQFEIFAPATQKSDGSYSDYGVWTVNAKFDGGGGTESGSFAADIGISTNGAAVIKIHEVSPEGESRIFLNRTHTSGFGRLSFPDHEGCMQDPCMPKIVTATYAYNTNHLAVKKGGGTAFFKDRNQMTEMTERYGLFDGVTGADVLQTKSFGFPVEYGLSASRQHAFYGAWQGRHQIWAQGSSVPDGTSVTRQVYQSGQSPMEESYTVKELSGVLTRRSLKEGSLDDLLNIPAEHFENRNIMLSHDGVNWMDCTYTFGCSPESPIFKDFDLLVMNPNDSDRRVFINGQKGVLGGTTYPVQYVYLPQGPSGAGFYEVQYDASGPVPGAILNPVSGTQLHVSVNGRIFIEYKAAIGWVKKTLTSFDKMTWTPVFDDTRDTPYLLELNREYRIHANRNEFVVKRTGTEIYDVKNERYQTANPKNAAGLIPNGVIFKPNWASDNSSTFEFIADVNAIHFLKLVYKTVGSQDAGRVAVGDVVKTKLWGLVGTSSDLVNPIHVNWEYPDGGENWGKQQFLVKEGIYQILDDPIMLSPVTLPSTSRALSLEYDGWMHGLPDLFHELYSNNFMMTPDIANKVINIPAGQVVTDTNDPTKAYLVKPLVISQFLNNVADPGTLDLAQADAVDLSTMPTFVDHGMGAIPDVAVLKYIEGKKVQ